MTGPIFPSTQKSQAPASGFFSEPRITLSGLFFTALALMVIFQMITLQHDPEMIRFSQQSAEMYGFTRQTIYPDRGEIYDRNGRLLAGNKTVYEIGVVLYQRRNPETAEMESYVVDQTTIVNTLSAVLKMDVDFNAKINEYKDFYFYDENNKRQNLLYGVLADPVDQDKMNRIIEIAEAYEIERKNADPDEAVKMPTLNGIRWRAHSQRIYPEYSLASNVIGFYSSYRREGRGRFGVEEKYDDLLSGIPQQIQIPLDPNVDYEIPLVPPGQTLILTIDREIQAMVEQVMDEAVEKNDAKSGTAIVLDPETGEILAMTTTKRMDLNRWPEYETLFDTEDTSTPFNPAITKAYEPGSVFKVVTMASALDSGTVQPSTTFVDTGVINVGGWDLYNWDRGAWGPQDMTGCLQHSLNVCLAWIATEMGPSTFYTYMRAFGLHRLTNVDLAGEAYFPMRSPSENGLMAVPGDEQWYPVNLGTNSYGQGIAVTPLQMVSAISAVANDGKIMAPHVLRAVVDNGKQYNNPPQVVNAPISPQTAHTLTDMLAVSLEQEASTALVPGYRIAGKTGTGSIPYEGGYRDNVTNTSFVGWGPADDPRFVVYVWLEEPTSSIWGSVVAAPVFSEIVQKLVVLMNIPPDEIRLQVKGT